MEDSNPSGILFILKLGRIKTRERKTFYFVSSSFLVYLSAVIVNVDKNKVPMVLITNI